MRDERGEPSKPHFAQRIRKRMNDGFKTIIGQFDHEAGHVLAN